MTESESVPLWWIALFPVLAPGSGVAVVFSVGGSPISEAVVLPLFL